jgi:branched-chain amino acid transport system permease protein
MTFIVATMFAGFVGSFYAMYFSYIDPSNFSQEISTKIMSMVLFGGLGSFVGSFLGAFTLSILPELTRGLSQYRFLFYGAIIVVVMLVRPQGLMGNVNFDHLRDLVREKRKPSHLPPENQTIPFPNLNTSPALKPDEPLSEAAGKE